jgi:hypothetical protein
MIEDQTDLFSGGKSIEETRIDAAKEILLSAGYRLIEPIMINEQIVTQKRLRDYFYMRLDSKYPNRCLRRPPNIKYDMQIISRFVKSRMDGASEKRAIQECVAIIDALFDYEDDFNFKYPISDIGILGQGKLAWITEKAITIIEIKKNEKIAKEIYRKADEIENDCTVDVKERMNNLDALLENMEANNG